MVLLLLVLAGKFRLVAGGSSVGSVGGQVEEMEHLAINAGGGRSGEAGNRESRSL